MEPKVIFEDNEILVLDKPAGMIVNRSDTTKGEETLQDWVEARLVIPNLSFGKLRILSLSNGFRDPGSNEMLKQVQHDTKESESDFYKRAGIVHRLDKETSGILIVAKTPEAFENLQKQFKERKVKKTYLALVHGEVKIPEGEINVPVGRLPWNRKRFGVLAEGREAVTKYKVLCHPELVSEPVLNLFQESYSSRNEMPKQVRHDMKVTLLELYPQTGRTHQIRVHLKYFGYPIFADLLYGGRKTARNDRKLLSRIFLHAAKISFNHPKTSLIISFESKLPEELGNFLKTFNS